MTYQLAGQLHIAGRTDFLNVLNAQRVLYTSEDALVQNTHRLATDLIGLCKALVGGLGKKTVASWPIEAISSKRANCYSVESGLLAR